MELLNAAFDHCLLVLGILVLRVVGRAEELFGRLDLLGYFAAPDGFEITKFLLDLVEAFLGYWLCPVHEVLLPAASWAPRHGNSSGRSVPEKKTEARASALAVSEYTVGKSRL
jgi:hypothetical protein